ncbi:MAG: retroviral-like aspartic protease family protein [Treponema sp.]|jgi:clan AA aspartic protease|nr:retroviral-like aspartic protease family protein [Treponema sp.]
MGTVYEELMLKNAGDAIGVWRGYTTEEKVRQVSVKAMVDTGAGTLVMGEDTCRKLGLTVKGLRTVTLAGGEKLVARITEPVEIHWKNRESTCNALVLPGEHEVLLGAIPLEDMDLTINPKSRRLEGAHGEEILSTVK